MGTIGCISVTANAAPRLWRAVRACAGDYARDLSLQDIAYAADGAVRWRRAPRGENIALAAAGRMQETVALACFPASIRSKAAVREALAYRRISLALSGSWQKQTRARNRVDRWIICKALASITDQGYLRGRTCLVGTEVKSLRPARQPYREAYSFGPMTRRSLLFNAISGNICRPYVSSQEPSAGKLLLIAARLSKLIGANGSARAYTVVPLRIRIFKYRRARQGRARIGRRKKLARQAARREKKAAGKQRKGGVHTAPRRAEAWRAAARKIRADFRSDQIQAFISRRRIAG